MSAQEADAAIVAAMVRDFDFPRYAAALFTPPTQRRAMLALAAFDLDILRIADQVSQPLPGEVRLQWWTDALEGTEHGGVAGNPVAAELLRALDSHALPRAPLLSLIEAHKFDLYGDPMPSMAALEVYCDDTVGSLIGLNAAMLARDASTRGPGPDAGLALGLARLVTRLPHDAAQNRCFLPSDLLATRSVTHHQVVAGDDTPGLRTVRGALIASAREYLARARSGLKTMPHGLRPALLPLATLRRELDALEKLSPLALSPMPSRLRVLASQWWMMR